MFLGSIGNDSLALLRHTILLVSIDAPPFVLSPFEHTGLTLFKSLRFESDRLGRLSVSVRIKINPKRRRCEVICWDAKANDLPRLFAYPGGRMAYMRGEDEMGDSGFRDPFDPGGLFHSDFGRLPFHHGTLHCHIRVARRMQRDGVRAIGGVLSALEPITKLFTAAHYPAAIISNQQVITWKQWRRRRAYIGEDETSCFPRIIGGMLDTIFKRTVFGLRGLLQALAAQIIEPTVVAASDAFFLDPAEFQRCATMRTEET